MYRANPRWASRAPALWRFVDLMHKSNLHYWLALHPDVVRPIGGVKQMHRLAEALVRSIVKQR